MAKRNNNQVKLIKINPINNSNESLIAVAILNALILLKAEENELVKIPERKELTKLLKNAKFENVIKALDEVNNIRIRPVLGIEDTSGVGLFALNHPIKGKIPCLVYRDTTLLDGQIKIVNSGLGDDELVTSEQVINDKLLEDNHFAYQIFLNTGSKNIFKDKELSCNDCNHYNINSEGEEICLYDNEQIKDCNQCCSKFIDCFKWRQPKGE